MPVSSQITVWYSKIACSTPWLISGWYGVYAVRNSPRESTHVGDGGDVVVVDPRAEERELRARVDVPRGELLDVPHELGLAERRRHVELAVEAHPGRHLLEELVDRGDADRREHLLAVGVGQREVARRSLLGDVRAVRLGVHAARPPRPGRRGGCGGASPRRTGPR